VANGARATRKREDVKHRAPCLTIELTPPTHRQRQRIEDGLHLVFDLLARRCQRVLRERKDAEDDRMALTNAAKEAPMSPAHGSEQERGQP